jgi:hypothetical protein
VRPRFFCGQLLTDQDLTASLTWAQNKFRLARYTDGWGVVCGLHVSKDSKKVGWINVSPGYAVSCCGDDIVLCKDKPFDLGKVCDPGLVDCSILRSAEAMPQAEAAFFAEKITANVYGVDLYLHYKEEEIRFQTALGREACQGEKPCEASRMLETGELTKELVSSDEDSLDDAADAWLRQYREWLMKQAEAYGNLSDEAKLFRLMQAYPQAPLNDPCYSCSEGYGVPLARVWMRLTAEQMCEVLAIDAYPPYRRPLRVDPLPAPPGQVNLAKFLWHRSEHSYPGIASRLADMGLRVKAFKLLTGDDAAESAWNRVKSGNVCVPFNKDLTVYVYPLDVLGDRVVGFSSGIQGARSSENVPSRDDLAKIEGIGPKYADDLHVAGYHTYADVAGMTQDALREVLSAGRPIRLADDTLAGILESAAELARRGR